MPQMVNIQPVLPQVPPASTPAKKEQSSFFPHLEKAISGKKQHQQDASADSKNTLVSENENPSSENQATASVSGTYDLLSDTQIYIEKSDNADILPDTRESLLISELPDSDNLEELSAIPEDSQEQNNITSPAIVSGPTHTISVTAQSQTINASTKVFNNTKSGNIPPLSTEKPALTLEPPNVTDRHTDSGSEQVLVNTNKASTSRGRDALFGQLQKIIDNGDEIGTVSIAKRDTISLRHGFRSTQNLTTASSLSEFRGKLTGVSVPESDTNNFNGLFAADVTDTLKTSDKQNQQFPGTRYDIQQQYFKAKISTQNLTDKNLNFEQNQQGDKFFQKSLESNLQSGLFNFTEQTNTFSAIVASAQETSARPPGEIATPVVLPSGTIVQEAEIIQQVLERFQFSSKHLDTRINIKLHPAELGELKIDLTVKEGSIRANVVAQSQHTLEILEKNIQKLKTELENQGFTIDQISITAESGSVGDFNLFDRQFSNHSDYTPTTQKVELQDDPTFTVDPASITDTAMNSGVNVKI